MPVQVRVSGAWRGTHAFVRVAGAWRSAPLVYVKVGGAWRALHSYSWAVGGWGGCSASCGGGMQYRSVTCARNDGVIVGDEVCSKLVGGKPGTAQACNTQSCAPACCCNWNAQQVRYYTNNLPCTRENVGDPWPNTGWFSHLGCLVNGRWAACTHAVPYRIGYIYGITGEQSPGLNSSILRDHLGRIWNCSVGYHWCGAWSPCSALCNGFAN